MRLYQCIVLNHKIPQYFYHMKKTNKSPQPHHSPVKFLKEAKDAFKPEFSSTLFFPYAQERDGLGRLIKASKKQINLNPINKNISLGSSCVLANKCTSQTCVSVSDKITLIEDIITNSFQYKNPCQFKLYECNKIQIHKKITLTIPSIKSNRKYSGQDLYVPNMTEEQPRRQRYLSSDLTLQNKNEMNILSRYQSLPKIIRNDHKFLDQAKSNNDADQEKIKLIKSMSPSSPKVEKMQPRKKKIKNLSHQKVLIPLAARIDSDGAPLNLQSYRRWPKLNSEIQKSNQIFLSKIIESKKLAYKIRLTLQAQQWDQK